MLKSILAAALGLAAFLLCARAEDVQPCVSPADFRKVVEEQVPEVVVRRLESGAAVAFLRAFNALPPRTDAKAEEILLISMPQSPQVVIALFDKGCMISRAVLPVEVLNRVLASIEVEA